MTERRKTEQGKVDAGDAEWLAQYYTGSKTCGDFGNPLPESAPAPTDLLLAAPRGVYELTGQVGVGGMKIVHRAHDPNTDRDVALAMLQKHSPRSSRERRFLREARITAALEHPNIVPVHEIGLDAEGCPYFTMKLLGGENLHDILNHLQAHDPVYAKQYPLGRLLEIFQSVCHAIAFAHSRGVIHLDIKPANVQVGSFGEVLVLDWGLAKILDSTDTAGPIVPVQLPELLREQPTEGVVRGTPGYMAPEQERGDFRAFDPRTDVFALGALLKAMLKSKWAPRQAPAALEAVVAKAMAPAPHTRYQKVEQVARDVRSFLGGYAVSAQSVGFGALFWLLVKRHKAVSVVVLASSMTIAALLAVFIMKIRQSERRALDTLAKLSTEQTEKARIGRFAAPQLRSMAAQAMRNRSYDEALAHLSLSLAFDDAIADAWVGKGLLHIGRQEFDEAVSVFNRVANLTRRAKGDPSLRPGEIAEKYRQLALPAGRLSPTHLLQLVTDIANKTNRFTPEQQQIVLGQLFQQENRTRPIDAAHLEFVGAALAILNPPASNVVFSFMTQETGVDIEIHGDAVTQLLPLAGLRMHALDLSCTSVEDLRWIDDSGLEVLDLSGKNHKPGSRVKDLTPLFSLPITELRLVNCAAIRFDQLRSLPKLERVVVSRPQVAIVERILLKSQTKPQVVAE
jgi:serine/threonine protein kinase